MTLFSLDCGETYYLDNGFVNFTEVETTFNQSVTVQCNDGYEINGDPFIHCRPNGSWSTNTTCQIIGTIYYHLFESHRTSESTLSNQFAFKEIFCRANQE